VVDNIELNTGSGGAAVRTDDDGTAHWQYVKIAYGADGTRTIVGSTSSNPLPVALSDVDNAVLDAIEVTANAIQAAVEGTLTVGSHAVTNAGTFAVQVDGDALTALQLIDDAVAAEASALGKGVLLQGDDGTDRKNVNVDATTGDVQVDVTNTVTVDATGQGDVPITLDGEAVALAAGSNLVGDVGIGVRTSGGCSIYYDADLDETAVAVKAGAGQVYAIHAFNTTAAPLFLQLFNIAQGSVTVGTTAPTMQYVIPGNADSDGAGFVLAVPQGIAFGTAITAAASTDSEGNGAPGTGACIVDILYA
jgi:hypothetical protein